MTSKQNNSLLPVYLISGEDELKRETVIKRLRKRISTLGDLSFNSDVFNGESASGEEIVAAANTLPFASNVRLVQVNNAEKLRKADMELLIDYLASPCQTTVLALLANKLAKNTRLYKAVGAFGKTAYIDCAPFQAKDLNGAVRQMALTHGVTFTEGAAASLIDLVGTNTVALDNEIKKLALAHRGDDAVNQSEVIQLVAHTAEIKPWEFIDSFGMKNLSRCIHLYNRMEKTSPHQLLALCISRIRDLISVKALSARGNCDIASTMKIPPWRLKTLKKQAARYTMPQLISALSTAQDTELAMKSGSNPRSAFLDWVIATISQ
jgi:DNA polymerase-3 subunit delta